MPDDLTLAEPDRYALKADRVAIRHRLGDLVAVIEIVSPGNKSSKAAIRSFVDKAVQFLHQGVHLLIIDLFPPTPRPPGPAPAHLGRDPRRAVRASPRQASHTRGLFGRRGEGGLRRAGRGRRCPPRHASLLRARTVRPDTIGTHLHDYLERLPRAVQGRGGKRFGGVRGSTNGSSVRQVQDELTHRLMLHLGDAASTITD